jgi:hypothetical protein
MRVGVSMGSSFGAVVGITQKRRLPVSSIRKPVERLVLPTMMPRRGNASVALP